MNLIPRDPVRQDGRQPDTSSILALTYSGMMEELSVFDRLDVMRGLINAYRTKTYTSSETLERLVSKKRTKHPVSTENTSLLQMSAVDLDRSYRQFMNVKESEDQLRHRRLQRYNNRWKNRLLAVLVRENRRRQFDDLYSHDSDSSSC